MNQDAAVDDRRAPPPPPLTAGARLLWRTRALALQPDLLHALLVDRPHVRHERLLQWVANIDVAASEDSVLVRRILDYLVSLKDMVGRELISEVLALRDINSERMDRIHAAAQAFQAEYGALVASQ